MLSPCTVFSKACEDLTVESQRCIIHRNWAYYHSPHPTLTLKGVCSWWSVLFCSYHSLSYSFFCSLSVCLTVSFSSLFASSLPLIGGFSLVYHIFYLSKLILRQGLPRTKCHHHYYSLIKFLLEKRKTLQSLKLY